jgi:hypothetical protein
LVPALAERLSGGQFCVWLKIRKKIFDKLDLIFGAARISYESIGLAVRRLCQRDTDKFGFKTARIVSSKN